MNLFGFGQSADIEIVFDGAENRKTAEVKGEDGKVEKMLLYYDGETVSGKVNVTLKKPGCKLEHQGIKIEFIGQIELFYDRGNHHEFKCLAKALARPGDLLQNTSYPFDFPNVEKQFEVYAGSNVRLRYFLRATIVRRISDITREVDIAVHTLCSYPEMNNPIKMEVGIEDCLHIEFEYNKSKYHLKDTIIGKIYFLLVRIKIKHMEIAIIKRETTGSGPNVFTENETIAKYEIMDGAPVKGESIPIRVFLAGYNLTPTMRDINKKFSVKYFLNLVLMDTEDRRYFKQQEITLWRKADIPRYHAAAHQQQMQPQHQQVPHHAPPHLVGGPAAPTVAPSLLAAAAAAAAAKNNSGALAIGGGSGSIDNEADLGIGSGMLPGLTSTMTATTTTSESKMGLFTRESPNQEFSQQLDSPLPTSPVTPTAPTAPTGPILNSNAAVTATVSATATVTASANPPVPIERGIGDGAAATNTSPVMLLTTPPPLPVTGSERNIEYLEQEQQQQQQQLKQQQSASPLVEERSSKQSQPPVARKRDLLNNSNSNININSNSNSNNDDESEPSPSSVLINNDVNDNDKNDVLVVVNNDNDEDLTEIALPSPPLPSQTTTATATSVVSSSSLSPSSTAANAAKKVAVTASPLSAD